MSIASFLSTRRRMIAICALSALMHAAVIGWVGGQLGPREFAGDEPGPIVAVMLKAPAPPQAPKPAAQPEPAAPPKTPRRAPRPAPEAFAEPALETVAEAALPLPDLAPETLALPELAAAPEPQAEPQPEPQPEPEAGQRYRVSLPPSSRLSFDVARKDAKGAEYHGASEMVWQPAGDSYRLSADIFLNVLITRVNVGRVSSEGALTEEGIVPRRMLEKRMGRAETATHFDPEGKRITFSRSERTVPLAPGAQDRASVPFQLAGIARADSAQLAAGVEIQVGSERDATRYSFVLAGEEEIDTPMGRLSTWRLVRAPRPGSYSGRLDLWLAPQHGWLPVQIRTTEANGAVTTQTIRTIVTDTGNG
jgi:hypothetical protein